MEDYIPTLKILKILYFMYKHEEILVYYECHQYIKSCSEQTCVQSPKTQMTSKTKLCVTFFSFKFLKCKYFFLVSSGTANLTFDCFPVWTIFDKVMSLFEYQLDSFIQRGHFESCYSCLDWGKPLNGSKGNCTYD